MGMRRFKNKDAGLLTISPLIQVACMFATTSIRISNIDIVGVFSCVSNPIYDEFSFFAHSQRIK